MREVRSFILFLVILACGCATPSTGASGDAAAAAVDLLANEEWYRTQPGAEADFEGVLESVPRPKLGFGGRLPFQLVMADESRDVYVGARTELLQPYVGKRVRLTGKTVEREVEGRHRREIWPARITALSEP